MNKGNETWVRFVMKVVLLGVVVMVAAFAGIRLANARPGVAGGTARTFVTVAGSITGLTGTQSATFHFRRRGVMIDLCAPRGDIVIGAGGAFSMEVPLDEAATRCPETMFDGSDVVVDVDLPGHPAIVREANINPVPYAMRADFANAAGGQLETRIAALDRRVQALETPASMVARGAGTMTEGNARVPVPRSALLGGSATSRVQRVVMLTVRASNGRGVILTGEWLVITGEQSGAVALPLGLHRYVGVAAIGVEPAFDQGTFTASDVQQGVTLVFANWPAGGWSWSYTSVPIDLPSM